jgi:hypothetical protein
MKYKFRAKSSDYISPENSPEISREKYGGLDPR